MRPPMIFTRLGLVLFVVIGVMLLTWHVAEGQPAHQATAEKLNSAGKLLAYCRNFQMDRSGIRLPPDQLSGAMFCFGYISGFTEAHNVGNKLSRAGRKQVFCTGTFTIGDLINHYVAIATNTERKDPEMLKKHRALQAFAAFTALHKCNKPTR